jgi:hypothetical protein
VAISVSSSSVPRPPGSATNASASSCITAPDFSADRYHQQLADARATGWLAQSPLAVLVLDREAGEFFLRSRATAFPGRQLRWQ